MAESDSWGQVGGYSDPIKDIKKWADLVKAQKPPPFNPLTPDLLQKLLDDIKKNTIFEEEKEVPNEWEDSEELIKEAMKVLQEIVSKGATLRDKSYAKIAINLLKRALGE